MSSRSNYIQINKQNNTPELREALHEIDPDAEYTFSSSPPADYENHVGKIFHDRRGER